MLILKRSFSTRGKKKPNFFSNTDHLIGTAIFGTIAVGAVLAGVFGVPVILGVTAVAPGIQAAFLGALMISTCQALLAGFGILGYGAFCTARDTAQDTARWATGVKENYSFIPECLQRTRAVQPLSASFANRDKTVPTKPMPISAELKR